MFTHLDFEELCEVHEGLYLVLEDADLSVVHEVHQVGQLGEPHAGRHDQHRVLTGVTLQKGPFEKKFELTTLPLWQLILGGAVAKVGVLVGWGITFRTWFS